MIIIFFGIIQCTFNQRSLFCIDSNRQEDMMLKSPIRINDNDHDRIVIIQNRSKLPNKWQKRTKTNNNVVYEQYIPKSLLANLKEKEKIELASMAILTAPNEVQLMDQTSFEPKFSLILSTCSNVDPSSNISFDKRSTMGTPTAGISKKNVKRSKISDESLVQSSLVTKSRTITTTVKAGRKRSKIKNYSNKQRHQNDDDDDDRSRSIGIRIKTMESPKYDHQQSNADDGYKSKIIYSSNINNNHRHHSTRPLPTSGIIYRPSNQQLSTTTSHSNNNNDSNIE
ncbi:hypothetical protein BLA29_004342 [Euroglyphus maynei]|uniref:Uncharacterized protein n=1 Tax=Euroglyphus maynei TaxID=6958 RepID=A0A1Y3BAZ2_EURMA|nr:hypothetical protein BLA29_004342 [Euroglyphus maynei]